MLGRGGHCVGGSFIVFGCFVDIKQSLAGGAVGLVWTLAVGAFESGVRAGLSSCPVGGADMVACVVFPSTELTSDLLSANCAVVTKALAGIALHQENTKQPLGVFGSTPEHSGDSETCFQSTESSGGSGSWWEQKKILSGYYFWNQEKNWKTVFFYYFIFC